ncbi:LacI family DNA-binding transcriptional regulator [Mediterraneibacter sp. NSJ-55]|uniref:LacI family DNA-binding transcriptional regulator n=1 Tax=Mediterraneibacter hominis TaxID=2763054 RepID=A0A923LLU1_9FIRM|nr:LacI family DNA-binding transcriptional regulator [Mediterraneibacter hominis]MBC5690291.1 LacI family DNA-binding transcriptional regulator [Mediterraneibacter hominis]
MATIFDVAKIAHVSKSTVSRVINGDPRVKPETKRAVEDAIAQLQYSPSYFAKGIRTGQTKTIAFLVPEYTNMFYGEMFNGVEDTAVREGYMVMVCNTGNAISEKEYINELLKRNIDGIIYNTYGVKPAMMRYLKQISEEIPIIFMDEVIGKKENVSCVYTDGYLSTMQGVHFLKKTGCKKIGYIRNMDSIQATESRFEGFKDGLKECGLPYLPQFVYQCPAEQNTDYMKAGIQAGTYFASLKGERPDALMTAIDLLAIGCVTALCNTGIHVPEDISVIGYDNISLGELTCPALTTIAQPTREMGKIAAEMLIDQIRKGAKEKTKKIFEGEIIVRQTTRQIGRRGRM